VGMNLMHANRLWLSISTDRSQNVSEPPHQRRAAHECRQADC
jgi:hypothetical protein